MRIRIGNALLLLFGIALISVGLSSCASVSQRLDIAPLPPGLPVSASSSLFVGGKVIPDSRLKVIKQFSYIKYFSARMSKREVELDLSSDLRRIAKEAGANAITGLKIQVLSIHSPVGWIAVERSIGVTAMFIGAVGTALIVENTPHGGSSLDSGVLYPIALGGVGLAILGGSWLHSVYGNVGYSMRIEGNAVVY